MTEGVQHLTVALLLGCALGNARADIIDDFEDGNYTSNPVWFISNDIGSDAFVQDLLNPTNTALAMHGTDGGHRRIATETGIAWSGFSYAVDFRADGVHQADFQLLSNLPNDTVPSLTVRWTRTDTTSAIVLREDDIDLLTISLDYSASDNWTTVAISHDPGTHAVSLTLSDAVTGDIIADGSVMFNADFATAGNIRYASIGAQETDWQYFDNVRLQTVPAPGFGGFAAAGCLGFGARRGRRS